MNIETYIAVCLTLIVIAVLGVSLFVGLALWQLRRAARALEALSTRLGDQVGRLEGLAGALGSAALAATGRLGKGAALGASLAWGAINFFRQRRRARAAEESLEAEKESVS